MNHRNGPNGKPLSCLVGDAQQEQGQEEVSEPEKVEISM